ncbi:MAG: MFS transporter [Burkholderiales bacterium]|nr:MFS transporter [Burkholderiales bacterium]
MRRWIVFAVALAAYMLGLFHRVAPAAMAREIVAAFAASAAALGTLSATYFWVYTAMQLPSGILSDTVGPRRLLFAGGLVAAAGSALFGLAGTLAAAGAGRTLVALGTSVAFVATLKLVATWFEERRFATLTGVVVLAGNLSSALAGGPFAWLLEQASWRAVMLSLAAVSAAIAVAALALIDDPPRSAASHVPRGRWWRDLAAVLANRATWPIVVANFGMGAAFLGWAGLWAVPWLVDVQGMSRLAASNHASMQLVGFAVGGLVLGAVSDRIGRRKAVFLAGAVVHALLWIPFVAGTPLAAPASYVLFFALGFFGASLTMSWSCAKESNPPRAAGMATGTANLAIFLGPAVAQPLVGWVLDLAGPALATAARSRADWQPGVLVLAALAVAGMVAVLFVRETYARNVSAARAA